MNDRYLVLVRHAKAERPQGMPDIDRPLTARGHGDAAAAGVWLADNGITPELVLCSPARRTRQTWHGIALGMAESVADVGERGSVGVGGGPAVRYDAALYDGHAQDLLGLVRGVDEGVRIVLLIGHNPAVSVLSATLDPSAGSAGEGLRTSGIAVHRPAGPWLRCGPGRAALEATHTGRG